MSASPVIIGSWVDPIDIESVHRHAETLVTTLVDEGPASRRDVCKWLGWSPSRFSAALSYARTDLCPMLECTIPHPTPPDWLYRVTDQWAHVQAGASYSLGVAEARLRGIARDVRIVLPKIDREHDLLAWRRANFLDRHLDHLLRTLDEINGSG